MKAGSAAPAKLTRPSTMTASDAMKCPPTTRLPGYPATRLPGYPAADTARCIPSGISLNQNGGTVSHIQGRTGRAIAWAFPSQQASMRCKLVSAKYMPWLGLFNNTSSYGTTGQRILAGSERPCAYSPPWAKAAALRDELARLPRAELRSLTNGLLSQINTFIGVVVCRRT